ncbi:MAG: polysaccharide deacetylase family protein [Candidatus Eremiobacteraeota bacterium]|nr:polysaccharide deacetylase family protein [Candidatus Eremiobacteraeota bacterium]
MRYTGLYTGVVTITFALVLTASTALAQERVMTLQERMGYPAQARLLNIHADDFGMAHSIDKAIEQALEHGWVDSASIMVPCPWYPEVLTWARAHPQADLGIHMVLNSEWPGYRWGPIASRDRVATLIDPQGYFYNDPSRFTHLDVAQAQLELQTQIDKAQSDGIAITHLDSHMIALMTTRRLFRLYESLGQTYDLPIPLTTAGDYQMPSGEKTAPDALMLTNVITMDPGIPPQKWVGWYETTLAKLKPGMYQLIVHLAYDDPEMRAATHGIPDWGAAWRQRDFDMVRSTQFRAFLRDQHFTLVSWRQLWTAYHRRVPASAHVAARSR